MSTVLQDLHQVCIPCDNDGAAGVAAGLLYYFRGYLSGVRQLQSGKCSDSKPPFQFESAMI